MAKPPSAAGRRSKKVRLFGCRPEAERQELLATAERVEFGNLSDLHLLELSDLAEDFCAHWREAVMQCAIVPVY
jgi:hypothetical protein